MANEQTRHWRVRTSPERLEEAVFAFAARRIMRVVDQRPGRLVVKGGSTLAAGRRAMVLDWLPIRATISWEGQADGHALVHAAVSPRGRPHVRRAMFDALYAQKLSSWLSDLGRTLEAIEQPA